MFGKGGMRGGCAWWGHAWQGACLAGGCAWQGACMVGVCMAGACMAGEMATAADGRHTTGIHSCVSMLVKVQA